VNFYDILVSEYPIIHAKKTNMYNLEQIQVNQEEGADRRDVIRDSLRGFIQENKMTARQVEDAYFICIDQGVTGDGGAIPDERVISLAKRFSDAEQDGFALNAIGGIVSEIERHSAAPEKFLAFIETLPVDDRSRRSLLSIFEQNRTGEIRFLDPKTLEYIIPHGMRLPDTFKALPVEDRAEQLLDILTLFVKKIGDREFGIEFSEKG